MLTLWNCKTAVCTYTLTHTYTHTDIIEVMRKHGPSRKLHKCNSRNRWLHAGSESHSNTTVRLSHTPIIRKSAISIFCCSRTFHRWKVRCLSLPRPSLSSLPNTSACFISPEHIDGDHIWGETYLHGVTTVITALYFSKWRETHINTSVSYNSVLD